MIQNHKKLILKKIKTISKTFFKYKNKLPRVTKLINKCIKPSMFGVASNQMLSCSNKLITYIVDLTNL